MERWRPLSDQDEAGRNDRARPLEIRGGGYGLVLAKDADLPGGDAVAFVQSGIRSMAQRYDVRLRIALPADVVEAEVGRWATVTPDGDGCRVHLPTDSLAWPLLVLARLDADFIVDDPPELRAAIASAAERFARAVPQT